MAYKSKENQRKAEREWYQRNKKKHIEDVRKCNLSRRIRYKKILIDSLGGKCEKCGINNIVVLDFHHNENKIESISNILTHFSLDKAINESKKCRLLCKNCHAILHHDERLKLRK